MWIYTRRSRGLTGRVKEKRRMKRKGEGKEGETEWNERRESKERMSNKEGKAPPHSH